MRHVLGLSDHHREPACRLQRHAAGAHLALLVHLPPVRLPARLAVALLRGRPVALRAGRARVVLRVAGWRAVLPALWLLGLAVARLRLLRVALLRLLLLLAPRGLLLSWVSHDDVLSLSLLC